MKKQSKNILVGILAVVAVFIGIQIFSTDTSSSTETLESGMLTISDTSWNLGDVPMSEGVVTNEITLYNESSATVTVTRLETSCMCTTAQIVHANGDMSGIKGMVGHGGTATLTERIGPGETVVLLVNYDPNAHGPDATGPITRTVELETDSQEQPEIRLTFSGNVIK